MLPRRLLPPALLLAVLTVAVFLPVVDNGFISFDDDRYITDNPVVQRGLTAEGIRWAFTTTHAGNWHPLTWLSHELDVQLYGMDAGCHHLIGLAIHTLNAVLLFLLLAGMTGTLWRSLLVAALFAVHPLHVESVAWAAERKDLLAGCFWMLASGAYLAHVRRPGAARFALVIGFFALGLLTKPMLVTFPFVALLLDYWPLGRPGPARRLVVEKAPLFLLAAASSAVTFLAQREHGTLAGPLLPLAGQCANALVSYVAYLRMAVLPEGLSFFYPMPGRWSSAAVASAVLLLAALTGVALRLLRQLPFLAVGWLWYIGTLVLVIGLVQVGGQALADRYTYLPLTGVFIALAWLLNWGATRIRGAAVPATAAAIVAVAALALAARSQVTVWRDDITLYGHALDYTRDNYLALTNLGFALGVAGRNEEALAAFDQASRVIPRNWRPRLGQAEALARLGRLDEAEQAAREALELNGDSFEGRNFLGQVLLRLGRTEEAWQQSLLAMELAPRDAGPMNNLGDVALARGRPEEAEQWFRRALAERHDFPEAHHGLAISLIRLGRVGEAVDHLREALRLRPDSPEVRDSLERALELDVK